ncbi:MAG: type II secretion system protein [Synergistaceae bacterium]|nr:type II secretion system protein [Synergistaceae bacterium]
MGNKIKRKGFSLVEILMVILVMGVMAAIITISPNVAKQSAKSEAERIAAYIYRKMQTADRIHKGFELDLRTKNNDIRTIWDNEEATNVLPDFQISAGCSYSNNYDGRKCTYNVTNKWFPNGGTITVNGADGKKHYVIIADGKSDHEGRIRLSDTPPD